MYVDDRYQRMKAQGICVKCRKVPTENNRVKCKTCLEKDVQKKVNKYHQRSQKGLCCKCGSSENLLNSSTRQHRICETCFYKQVSRNHFGNERYWEKLKHLLISQKYLCPYTGIRLYLGNNASLEHKLPRNRFPELEFSLENLEWIDLRVNKAKSDSTPEEFLALVKAISDYKEY